MINKKCNFELLITCITWENVMHYKLALPHAWSVPSQESEWSCICVLEESILPLSIFQWILELVRQCDILELV
jgi:hypothetical protein